MNTITICAAKNINTTIYGFFKPEQVEYSVDKDFDDGLEHGYYITLGDVEYDAGRLAEALAAERVDFTMSYEMDECNVETYKPDYENNELIWGYTPKVLYDAAKTPFDRLLVTLYAEKKMALPF